MLHIESLQKTFFPGTVNERKAIENLSLTVPKGQFITLIGGNGAGKSTLMKLISGTYLPDAGRITLDGKDITYLPEHKRAREIGHLFQDPLMGTAPGMTIEENLSLAWLRGSHKSLAPATSRKRAAFFREKLKQLDLGLEDRLKTRVGLLSGGQRQAITLLMATIATPKLLLLDEHTAALDPATAEKVMALTEKVVRENNITTLMITHNIQSALSCGDRTLMLQDGRIILDLSGQQREKMTMDDLLSMFREKSGKQLDSDRMLLS
jgi:putative ABC transport system ATP-binding protein